MKKINVIFDDEFNDVDILLVPDDVAYNIEHVVQEFNQWLSLPDNRSRFVVEVINGYRVIGIGTEEFLWWLNNIQIKAEPKAAILEQHTKLIPNYPCAEF